MDSVWRGENVATRCIVGVGMCRNECMSWRQKNGTIVLLFGGRFVLLFGNRFLRDFGAACSGDGKIARSYYFLDVDSYYFLAVDFCATWTRFGGGKMSLPRV